MRVAASYKERTGRDVEGDPWGEAKTTRRAPRGRKRRRRPQRASAAASKATADDDDSSDDGSDSSVDGSADESDEEEEHMQYVFFCRMFFDHATQMIRPLYGMAVCPPYL